MIVFPADGRATEKLGEPAYVTSLDSGREANWPSSSRRAERTHGRPTVAVGARGVAPQV